MTKTLDVLLIESHPGAGAACEGAAQLLFDPLRAEIKARTTRVLTAAGVDPDDVEVAVERQPPRLIVCLRGPAVSAAVKQALGVRVLDAVRASRRTFGQVDVSYEARVR